MRGLPMRDLKTQVPPTQGLGMPGIATHLEGPPDGIDDNAVHLLYDLTPAQFEALAAQWVAPLKDQPSARKERMGVSPRLKSEAPSQCSAPDATSRPGSDSSRYSLRCRNAAFTSPLRS